MKRLTQNASDFIELFYPRLCITCGERLLTQEHFLCFNCWHDIPATNFHHEPENKVAQLFWGRVKLENASAFFSYKKGSKYQKLIHYTKYKGLKELGYETGRRFALKLLESVNFRSIDILVPVPLHTKKQQLRGYNQSFWIAKGMAGIFQKPIDNINLYRKIYTSTQTKKNRFERWQNVEDIFGLHNPEVFQGKHILLVDDVVTTGATLEACAIQLLKISNTKVSIATLAFADI